MAATMNEVSFARSFLAMLDAQPVRYRADYAVDLRTLEPEYSFLLPRMPHAMRKPHGEAGTGTGGPPGSTPGIVINLRSFKNPQLDLQLSSQPLNTGISELKKRVAQEVGLSTTDKIRLLYRKRPCADSKTVKEILGPEVDPPPRMVEFSVMVMGGMSEKREISPDTAITEAPVAVGPSGAVVLEDPEFWSDLEGFLQQRLKDASVANQAALTFKEAWTSRPKP